MSHLLITTCTNRKKGEINSIATASNLAPGTQPVVFKSWSKALAQACKSDALRPAHEIYAGRGFREAQRATSSNSRCWIISAGLGLVNAEQPIPGYALTVSGESKDSVRPLISKFNLTRWWQDLTTLPTSDGNLQRLAQRHPRKLILLTLSSAYFELVKQDLLAMSDHDLRRFRIFGLSASQCLPRLSPYCMPYDSRLDGPDSSIPGTKGDFAQRAARHFVDAVLAKKGGRSLATHRDAVTRALANWRPAPTHRRQQISDEEVCELIGKHWQTVDGRSGAMLRLLRDQLSVACEQTRFKNLFHKVASEHASTETV